MGLDLSHVPVDLLIYLANIVVLFIILRALVYKPVHNFLEARKERVENQLAQAAKAEADAAGMKAEYQENLLALQQKGEAAFREKTVEANQQAQGILEKAKADGAALVEAARQQAELAHKDALKDMQDEILDIAVEMSSKILEREIDVDANRDIATDFFSKVG